MAYSLEVLDARRAAGRCRRAQPQADGHAALVAAGTGLGEAALHRVGGRLVPAPSEAGHADFAARTDRGVGAGADADRALRPRHRGARAERSGPGEPAPLHARRPAAARPWTAWTPAHHPAAVTTAALEGRCERCVEALRALRVDLRRRGRQPGVAHFGNRRPLRRRRHRAPHPAGHPARRHLHATRSCPSRRWTPCCGAFRCG